MVVLLTVAAVTVGVGRVKPKGVENWITITKTYDIYGVICTSGPCAQEGKCLGSMEARTCLTLCALKFDQPNTEYWVHDETGAVIGYSVNGVTKVACICRSTDGQARVRYTLRVKAKNPGKVKSLLTNATLCLAVTAPNGYVGSDYEQYDDVATDLVILPDPALPDSGQNVILCKLCP
jgi:hypothetical protein